MSKGYWWTAKRDRYRGGMVYTLFPNTGIQVRRIQAWPGWAVIKGNHILSWHDTATAAKQNALGKVRGT